MSDSTNPNPGNFANRPTDEVKGVAAMGGKASHGPYKEEVRRLCMSSGFLVTNNNAAQGLSY